MGKVLLPRQKQYGPLRGFISRSQALAIGQCLMGEEGEWFEEKMTAMAKLIAEMPTLYQQDGKGDAAIVSLHYFTGGCDWYILEKDSEPEQHQAFGFANIGYGAELGYISIVELVENNVELDLHFTPCTVGELKAKGVLE